MGSGVKQKVGGCSWGALDPSEWPLELHVGHLWTGGVL